MDRSGRGVSPPSYITLWTVCFCINLRFALENNSWTIVEVVGLALMILLLMVFSVRNSRWLIADC